MSNEPINSGAYALLFELKKSSRVFIPRFGEIIFKPGFYVYSGSAKKNLVPRVERHLRKSKILKWHIDYFSSMKSVTVRKVFLFTGRSECEINQFFKNLGGKIILESFGSSDCRNKCVSHFLYFEKICKFKPVIEFGGIDGKLFVL